MALTIQQWQALNPQPIASGIVEVFARTNPVLERLPFINIAGSAYRYNVEETLPGVSFRDFNAGYTESTGVVNPEIEKLTLLGGDSDFDKALIAMQVGDNDARAELDAMKAKSLSLQWLKTFLHGDTGVDPLSFDGLQKRISGDQLLSAGTNGGDLTLDLLDATIDACRDTPDLLVMNKPMRRELNRLIRASGHALEIITDQFGRQLQHYQGIPIGVIDKNPTDGEVMAFNETAGTNANTCSIYALCFGPGNIQGIQTAPMDVRDLGELEVKPAFRTRIEWYSAFTVKHGRAAARLAGLNQPS
jgi:hypothetical protein